ncbi:MAG: metallophosphoesterase [Desulfobacteraceae bacterium]|nr:MAG: metallophosphoesterase [Desulfobacteraceae bacterium]
MRPECGNAQAWLPVDKMLIVILFVFVCSLMFLFLGHLAYQFVHVSWSDFVTWMGWGGLISLHFFVCFCLVFKALEAILLQRFHSTAGQAFCLPENIKRQPKGNRHPYLPYGVITGLLAASITLTCHGMTQALKLPGVKEVVIHINDLSPDLEGLRIVQITDLHATSSMRPERVEQIVERVNAIEPEVIVLTGDIVDGSFTEINGVVAPLARLRSRLGRFFVTGNHEYLHNADKWTREMEALGFTVLFNEYRLIHLNKSVLLVGGIPDPRGDSNRPDPAKAAGTADQADVKILLAHRPDTIYDAAPEGFDIQLSGHTHGGQVGLLSLLRKVTQPFQSGLYHFKDVAVYVSNGTGYWGIPLRFGAPSEIAHIELTGNKKGSKAVVVDNSRFRIRGGW